MRKSTITQHQDSAGDYEQEIFTCENPKRIIIGVHGNGVRRWDGEKFYYQVAEHYTDSIIVLVDQNQVVGDGCKLNSLEVMVERNQQAIAHAKSLFSNLPVWVLGHSMGCGIATQLDTSSVDGIILVSPAVGAQLDKYSKRYGADIVNGKTVLTTEGRTKIIPKEFMDSMKNIVWQNEYDKLIKHFSPIHVFESGAEEIIDEERFELRDKPFTSYTIIEGAKHNFSGKHSDELFAHIDKLVA